MLGLPTGSGRLLRLALPAVIVVDLQTLSENGCQVILNKPAEPDDNSGRTWMSHCTRKAEWV